MRGECQSGKSVWDLYDRAVDHFDGGSVFVELGVYYGGSIIYLANEVRFRGKVIKIYGVDKWEYDGDRRSDLIFPLFWQNAQQADVDYLIKPICGDSALSAQLFFDNSVDFVFVDADHSYESVKCDIESWMPKIKDGGWMAGHDYDMLGVRRAVNDVFDGIETVGACWLKRYD